MIIDTLHVMNSLTTGREREVRYFNLKQHYEPKSMFLGERKADISELEKTAHEITKEQASQRPRWGSGNIAVDENGDWVWTATNWDTSG